MVSRQVSGQVLELFESSVHHLLLVAQPGRLVLAVAVNQRELLGHVWPERGDHRQLEPQHFLRQVLLVAVTVNVPEIIQHQ
jgi:hypothetical protein